MPILEQTPTLRMKRQHEVAMTESLALADTAVQPWLLAATGAGSSALITFLCYTAAVFGLAALSSRLLRNRDFLKEYFLGSRSLGVWRWR